jgi:LPS-assembly lipoprotein
LIVCLLISGCGFHLRGYNEDISTIHELSLSCRSTDAWALCHHLKQSLQLNDIRLNESATLQLSIGPLVQKSRVLSLQSNASAAEQGLSSEVNYQLITVSDEQVRHQHTVRINNSYRHESTALLAKDRERDELQNQLSRQLAEEIVRQIRIIDSTEWIAPANGNDVVKGNQPDNTTGGN